MLKRLYLNYNHITRIEKNSFTGLKKLTELYLENNGLKDIAPGALDELNINVLHLKDNKLEEMPVFRKPSEIAYLDLSSNPITKLDAKALGKHHDLEELHLRHTEITTLENRVFVNNTRLHTLSFRAGNLKEIRREAFKGPRITKLNLQDTNIEFLPGDGLEYLKHLIIKGALKLWEIPIVSFEGLTLASVEYAFHCCLIKTKYDSSSLIATRKSFTSTSGTPKPCNVTATRTTTTARPTTTNPFEIVGPKRNNTEIPTEPCYDANKPHNTPPTEQTDVAFNCSSVQKNDTFNPCGNLLASTALRVCSWVVLVLALFGNSFKLFVLLLSKRKISITKILMCNLAFANLCMGIFLLMIVSADMYSLGEYQNFAMRWQFVTGCKIAGFVSIFSTELSVFVLTIITVERYFTIVHPLKLNKHLNTKQIIVLIGVGWTFSLTMATLPLVGVSSYQEVAICLPFDVKNTLSKAYVTFVLATNGMAFFFVLFCYGRMYCSLGGSVPGACVNRVESRVARRMAMLVITNFACWFPIAFVSLVAVYGTTLIDLKTAQFFLIFVYPINSFTNPYLYAIGTKHFQLDALERINRLGICKSAVEKLSNKLQDQLETLPNSSRGVTGSKISLSSSRSPHHSPRVSPKSSFRSENRHSSYRSRNGSTRSNNSNFCSNSSRESQSCSTCNFLTIPLIHRKSFDLDRDKEIEDSRSSINMKNNEIKMTSSQSLSSNSELDKVSARRQSAKEVVVDGQIACLNGAARRSRDSDETEALMPLKCDTGDVNKNTEDTKDSLNLLVPIVLVTTC